MYTDSLFRVSFKCLIKNDGGEILAVKEAGRSSWDLPGGGIDHGETIDQSISRELFEETGFRGVFSYEVMTIHDPVKLRTRDVWQIKIIISVTPENMDFQVGQDADEVAFVDPIQFENSEHEPERRIYEYSLGT